jgi:hypothetical protein
MQKLGQSTSQALEQISNGSLQNSTNDCSQAVHKSLSLLTVELTTAGRLKGDNVDLLVETLTKDLALYPETWVIRAIHEHRKASPFWPALADLVKHMQPAIDAEERAKAFERNQQASREFVNAGGKQSELDAEERKAVVIAKLGYDPNDARSRRKFQEESYFRKQCITAGVSFEETQAMSGDEVLSKLLQHGTLE